MRICRPPSPSTRARQSTSRLMLLMALTFGAEGIRRSRVRAEGAKYRRLTHPQSAEQRGHRRYIRDLFGSKAAVAPTTHSRTQGTASGMSDRPHAGHSPAHRKADRSTFLALQAYAVGEESRAAMVQQSIKKFEKLSLLNRTAS